MQQIRLLVTIALLGLVIQSCNINPTKKAQTLQNAKVGFNTPSSSKNALTRSYDYFKESEEALIKRMRKP